MKTTLLEKMSFVSFPEKCRRSNPGQPKTQLDLLRVLSSAGRQLSFSRQGSNQHHTNDRTEYIFSDRLSSSSAAPNDFLGRIKIAIIQTKLLITHCCEPIEGVRMNILWRGGNRRNFVERERGWKFNMGPLGAILRVWSLIFFTN